MNNYDLIKNRNVIEITLNKDDKLYKAQIEDNISFRYRLFYILKDYFRNNLPEEEENEVKINFSFYSKCYQITLLPSP